MNAVFVHKYAVLRDSHVDPESPPEGWRLMPATLEAMRHLAGDETLLFLYGSCQPSPNEHSRADDEAMAALVAQIEAGGGRVDGCITCDPGGGGG